MLEHTMFVDMEHSQYYCSGVKGVRERPVLRCLLYYANKVKGISESLAASVREESLVGPNAWKYS